MPFVPEDVLCNITVNAVILCKQSFNYYSYYLIFNIHLEKSIIHIVINDNTSKKFDIIYVLIKNNFSIFQFLIIRVKREYRKFVNIYYEYIILFAYYIINYLYVYNMCTIILIIIIM